MPEINISNLVLQLIVLCFAVFSSVTLLGVMILLWFGHRFNKNQSKQSLEISEALIAVSKLQVQVQDTPLILQQLQTLLHNHQSIIQGQHLTSQAVQQALQQGLQTITQNLQLQKEDMLERFSKLSQMLERRLGENLVETLKSLGQFSNESSNRFKDLSLQLEKSLNEGFEKTTATFTDIVKRLALIDDAQKKLNELSTNVVSLQEILIDKRSRGAFGEVQLKNLIQNMLPPDAYDFQYTLPNGTRVDCILFLPEPSGNIAIDSKFPLKTFRL